MMLTQIAASFGVILEAALQKPEPIPGSFHLKPDEYGEPEGFHMLDDSGEYTGTAGYHEDGTDHAQGNVKMLKPRSGAGSWYYESDGVRWFSGTRSTVDPS